MLFRSRLAKTQSNLELAGSTEIQWKDRLDAIMAVTPDGVTMSSLVIANEGPVEGQPPSGDLFQRPSVGQLSFIALSVTRPDTVDWLNNLETIDGFADVRLIQSSATGTGADVQYSTTISIQVLDRARSQKFMPEEAK